MNDTYTPNERPVHISSLLRRERKNEERDLEKLTLPSVSKPEVSQPKLLHVLLESSKLSLGIWFVDLGEHGLFGITERGTGRERKEGKRRGRSAPRVGRRK